MSLPVGVHVAQLKGGNLDEGWALGRGAAVVCTGLRESGIMDARTGKRWPSRQRNSTTTTQGAVAPTRPHETSERLGRQRTDNSRAGPALPHNGGRSSSLASAHSIGGLPDSTDPVDWVSRGVKEQRPTGGLSGPRLPTCYPLRDLDLASFGSWFLTRTKGWGFTRNSCYVYFVKDLCCVTINNALLTPLWPQSTGDQKVRPRTVS